MGLTYETITFWQHKFRKSILLQKQEDNNITIIQKMKNVIPGHSSLCLTNENKIKKYLDIGDKNITVLPTKLY